MILVDTSVWIDHFRRRNATLVKTLEQGEVATHPFVIGELACGQLGARRQILNMLDGLPSIETLAHQEVLHFLQAHRLEAQGLGWIDVHLLAAAVLANVNLWTLDRRLGEAQVRIQRR